MSKSNFRQIALKQCPLASRELVDLLWRDILFTFLQINIGTKIQEWTGNRLFEVLIVDRPGLYHTYQISMQPINCRLKKEHIIAHVGYDPYGDTLYVSDVRLFVL